MFEIIKVLAILAFWAWITNDIISFRKRRAHQNNMAKLTDANELENYQEKHGLLPQKLSK